MRRVICYACGLSSAYRNTAHLFFRLFPLLRRLWLFAVLLLLRSEQVRVSKETVERHTRMTRFKQRKMLTANRAQRQQSVQRFTRAFSFFSFFSFLA
jgi:hypothetical protein